MFSRPNLIESEYNFQDDIGVCMQRSNEKAKEGRLTQRARMNNSNT